jgi:glycerol-3-phosphate dehydrogenase (NAD(P)+)
VTATSVVATAARDAAVVVSVTPAQHVRRVLATAAPLMRPDALVVSASKGIETATLQTMAEVLEEMLPSPAGAHATFLSGPSFALEVAREQPTAVAMASHHHDSAVRAQQLFQAPYFRVYTNADVIGVELGGALKNVIAIAAGIADGLGYGDNTKAALLTRGLAELTRLGIALGGNPLTFSGLAGMGDLVATCTSTQSRNRTVGVELGKGRNLDDIVADMKMVAEGVKSTAAVLELALRHRVEMPIAEQVGAVLYEGKRAEDLVTALMLREAKAELHGIT